MKKISLTLATIFLLSSAANAQQTNSTHKEEMEDWLIAMLPTSLK